MKLKPAGNPYSLISVIWIVFLCISVMTRIALLCSVGLAQLSVKDLLLSFCIGIIYDCVVISFIVLPFVCQVWLRSETIYSKKIFPFIVCLFITAIGLVVFTKMVPKDFSKPLFYALVAYLSLRLLIYIGLYYSSPGFRKKWRRGVLVFFSGLLLFLLLLNAVSEWFFWQEFATRYNFIAVDYLVYTNEVLGNIYQSYPVGWIICALLVITMLLLWLFRKYIDASATDTMPFLKKTVIAMATLLMAVFAYFFVPYQLRLFSQNNYANEMAGNGLYEFVHAFNQNELDFYRFYKTVPDDKAFEVVRNLVRSPFSKFTGDSTRSIEREINDPQPERRLNIVLISVESLSASFMQHFGSGKNITPQLDSLAEHSLFFTNLYASGTRTVRGLEALSMGIPPTPGQSIVKRPRNGNMFTIGSVLRKKGYTTQYLYGGYSYFDNMKEFFGNNGYQVIDRAALLASEIHYENIWGVADEDLFTLGLRTLDSNYISRKPFFTQIMTVSNHRPYTYPGGRIDIPPSRQTREGAVKYTDYAIGQFLKNASLKPWFDSTIFVIIADHCAGSAGSVELPVTGYHIPMLIYAPHILQPANVQTLTAQIDVAPTLLGMLHIDYVSKFFGRDVLQHPPGEERAFISTYQGLGYLKKGRLVVQSPIKEIREYKPDFSTGNATPVEVTDSLATEAISFYQSISWLLANGKQTGQ